MEEQIVSARYKLDKLLHRSIYSIIKITKSRMPNVNTPLDPRLII